MNFLAHIFLSGPNDLVKIGNFSADGVRGKAYLNYPIEMQVGILLHRFIDTYTDSHPLFKQSSKRLHERYKHYSRVIVDIYYDHFLAHNWNTYSDVSLTFFVQNFYQIAQNHIKLMPERFQHLTPYMIEGNWLEGYAQINGIASVLKGMDRRTNMISKMSFATEELQLYYNDFKTDFEVFFQDLILHTNQKRNQLENQYLK